MNDAMLAAIALQWASRSPVSRAAQIAPRVHVGYSITSSALASSVGGTTKGISPNGRYGIFCQARSPDHYGLMLAARITLAHFSVSSVMSVLKSADEPPRIIPPRST